MRKNILRTIATVLFIAAAATCAHASTYNFEGYLIDVEAWAGTGENETILVVDWNCIDNGTQTISESHAFGFRWDGTAYESDMLAALTDVGILTVTTGYGGGFVMNIAYTDDDGESHLHVEEGSWNLASTSDPYANWGTWGDSEWDFNTAGTTEELLVDGQFEGINAIMWFGSLPDYADDQLDVPFASVPVPGTGLLLGTGLLAVLGLTKKRK